MIKIKNGFFSFLLSIIVFSSFGQVNKSIELNIYEKGKKVKAARIYMSTNNSLELLEFNDEMFFLNEEQLKMNELSILLVYESKVIKFIIKPGEIYYLTITEIRKGVFRKLCEVNQGFDYVELVPIYFKCAGLFSSEIK